MSLKEKGGSVAVAYSTGVDHENLSAVKHADDVRLAQLGYKSEFKREFSVSLTSLLCIVLSVLLSYELSR